MHPAETAYRRHAGGPFAFGAARGAMQTAAIHGYQHDLAAADGPRRMASTSVTAPGVQAALIAIAPDLIGLHRRASRPARDPLDTHRSSRDGVGGYALLAVPRARSGEDYSDSLIA